MNHQLLKSHHQGPVCLKVILALMLCCYSGVMVFSDPQPISVPGIVNSLPVSSEQPLVISSSALLMRYIMKKVSGFQTAPVDAAIPESVTADIARFERGVTRSLEVSMEKALNEISTPVEDIRDAVRLLLNKNPETGSSFEQVTELHRCAIRLRNSLQYVMLGGGGGDREVLMRVVGDIPQVKGYAVRQEKNNDIRSLRDFLLYGIFGTSSPLSWVSEVVDHEILYVHYQCRTFELLAATDRRYQAASVKHRQLIDRFLDRPQWRLWANECRGTGALASGMARLGVGGCIRGLAVETRASNIVAATRSLRVFLNRK